MERGERIDFHTHTALSDGELLPSELAWRAMTKGHRAIAMSDHADASNLSQILERLYQFLRDEGQDLAITIIPAVELTQVPPDRIASLARHAKELGAGLVLVHGETLSEPVVAGTNRAAAECMDVDILAHPGLITLEDARVAAANGVCLEISARRGNSLANGHVANIARVAGTMLIVDTDAHSPDDLIDQAMAQAVARGAALSPDEVQAATVTNPRLLVERAQMRLGKVV